MRSFAGAPDVCLGIDAGGTRTRAVLVASDGAVVGTGTSGPANWNNVGLAAAMNTMRTAAESAWAFAGYDFSPARAVFVASAGVKAAGDCERLALGAAETGLANAARCFAANDAEAALSGGLLGRPGIALVAGTGSFCLGRDPDGRVVHRGGWGWAIDDIGSGFFLGREALRAVAFAADGRGRTTTMSAAVLQQFQAGDPDGLLAKLYAGDFSVGRISDLAPLVIAAARNGDAVAMEILQRGANGLAELAHHVASDLTCGAPELVIVGSVGRSGVPYQPLIETALRAAVPGLRLVEPTLPPVMGAALRALELGGISITPAVINQLRLDAARQVF